MSNVLSEHPRMLRQSIRKGKFFRSTGGLHLGKVQANLVMLPASEALEFLIFCFRNPKPCPVIEVVEAGSFEPIVSAPGADLRTDIPKYLVYENGKLVTETTDITKYSNQQMVSFLLGCSYTFEYALLNAGIPIRHIEQNTIVPMYVTSIETKPTHNLYGPLVVTMRPIPKRQLEKTIQITSQYPSVHGSPVHVDNFQDIGIKNLSKPDFGDPVEIKKDEIPVFWACGITPQIVAQTSKPPLMITHSPGHMFVTDLDNDKLLVDESILINRLED